METKKYRFDEVTINFDKKRIPLSSAQREKRQGTFRYYGAQGVIDHVDDYIFDGTYLLIAEDGENLKSKKQNIAQVVDGQFWVNNHAHIVQGNEQCDTIPLLFDKQHGLIWICHRFSSAKIISSELECHNTLSTYSR